MTPLQRMQEAAGEAEMGSEGGRLQTRGLEESDVVSEGEEDLSAHAPRRANNSNVRAAYAERYSDQDMKKRFFMS